VRWERKSPSAGRQHPARAMRRVDPLLRRLSWLRIIRPHGRACITPPRMWVTVVFFVTLGGPSQFPSADQFVVTMKTRTRDLFDLEKRRPEWAAEVEKRIHETLRGDFVSVFPDKKFEVESECRTSTCIVKIAFPSDLSESERQVALSIPQFASLGSSVEISGSGNTLSFEMTISKDRRNLEEFDRTMMEKREEIFTKISATDPSACLSSQSAAGALSV
jgi:hypothetical protein